jgi:hypothetical protein
MGGRDGTPLILSTRGGFARFGDRVHSVADCDAKLLDNSLQDVDFSQQEIY